HEHRTEMARQEAQHAGPQVSAPGLAYLIAKQVQPVLLVASLGICYCQQNVPCLGGSSLSQVPVHGGFGAFVGQGLAPATQIPRARTYWLRLSFGVHVAIIAAAGG